MKIIYLFFLCAFSGGLFAQNNDIIQSLQQVVLGQGRVTMHQSEEIVKLVGSHNKDVLSVKKATVERSVVRNKAKVETKSKHFEGSNSGVYEAKNTQKTRINDGEYVTLDTDEQDAAPRIVRKIIGYRVQVYAGNNTRKSKIEAQQMAANIHDYFPDVQVYTFFYTPRWLCRIGDYHSMEEAYAMLRKIKATGVFHEVSIVKDRINVIL